MGQEESAMLRFGGDTSEVARQLRGLRGVCEQALEPMKGLFSRFIIPLDVVGAIERIGEMFRETVDQVKEIERVSDVIGVSAKDWQQFAGVLREVGGNAEEGEKSLSHLKTLFDQAKAGAQESQNIFKKWHLSWDFGSFKEFVPVAFDYLNKLTGSEYEAAAGSDLMGKGWEKMLAAIQKTKEGDSARQPFITDEEISSVDRAADAFENLWAKMKLFGAKIIISALPHDFSTDPEELNPQKIQDQINLLSLQKAQLEQKIKSQSPTPQNGWMTIAETGGGSAQADLVAVDAAIDKAKKRLEKVNAALANPVEPPSNPTYDAAMKTANEIRKESKENELQGIDKINQMEADRADLLKQINAIKRDTNEKGELQIKLAQKEAEIKSRTTELENEQFRVAQQKRDLQRNLDYNAVERERALLSPYQMTIADLAKGSHFISRDALTGEQIYSGNNPAARMAAYIQDSQNNLKDYIATNGHGWGIDKSLAKSVAEQISSLTNQLANAGFVQHDTRLESIDHAAQDIRNQINNLVSGSIQHSIPVSFPMQ